MLLANGRKRTYNTSISFLGNCMRLMNLVAATMLLLASLPISAQSIPSAVIVDPPRNTDHPARNQQLLVPSAGAGMNALFLLAAGAGPKPTMLLLHGLPGNEQNLDLAQAVRRSGWNVLTFHYRGSWGSPGSFSVANALQDTDAATAFLRAPGVAEKYGVDLERLVIAGHSLGGFTAAMHAKTDAKLLGVALIDPADIGAWGEQLRKASPEERTAEKASLDDLGNSLAGADPESLIQEFEGAPASWTLASAVPGLRRQSLLAIGAMEGNAEVTSTLAESVRGKSSPNATVTALSLPTDHSFADHRIALAGAVIAWLESLPGKTTR